MDNVENCDTIDVSMARHVLLWFAKTMVFLRVYKKVPSKCLTKKFSRPSLTKEMRSCDCQNVDEFCFVQYFEDLSEGRLKVDKFDKILGCLRLRWHRASGEQENVSAGKEYGLVSIGAIRGTINLVTRNTMLCVLDKAKPRAFSKSSMCDGVDGWEKLSFYVDRFTNNKTNSFKWDDKM